MPHYYTSWMRTHHDHLGDGLHNPDSHADADGSYLSTDPVDDANGDIIVPGVYVDEISTFPPVGASAPSPGEDTADAFVWDSVAPAQDDSEPGLDGSGMDIGTELRLLASDAAFGDDNSRDNSAFALQFAETVKPELQGTGRFMEDDGLFA